MSATLIAGLEMARGGEILLRQERAFGPILVRKGDDGRN
jgi:segregation and condensation protein A